MATFKFHGTLKDHVPNGEVVLDGNRPVGESLAAVADRHAALKRMLYIEGTDTLHEYYIVLINDEQVQFLDDGMDTRLADEDVVKVFPPVAGG